MSFAFVTESRLDAWVRAHPVEATTLIPELINRLVSKSCPNAKEMRIPFGNSIGQPGADGFLRDDEGFSSFVPSGDSFWEIGTGPAATKATDDYRSRTRATAEEARKRSTLVIVNPRSAVKEWRDSKGNNTQEAWIEKRRSKGEWRNIRLIDGTKVVDWLLKFPDIGLWLAEMVVDLPGRHVETVDKHWELLQSYGGSSPLIPDLFLANRANAIQRLKEMYHSEAKEMRLHTSFPHQVVDFVCAFVASLEEDQRAEEAKRTLIVSDSVAWSSVCEIYRGANLVLVATPDLNMSDELGLRRIQKAIVCGHSVIYDAPLGGNDEDLTHRLQNPRNNDIYKSLTASGISDERSRTVADKCDRNIDLALRLLNGKCFLPAWAEGHNFDVLIFALLAGSWDHNSLADREILQVLTGQDYTEWCRQLRMTIDSHYPPAVELDGRWKFVSRLDGWNALGRRLDEAHLQRFHRAISMALFVDKLQLEIEEEEFAQLLEENKRYRISPELQRGLMEMLALMGSYPNVPTSMDGEQVELIVTRTVQKILRRSESTNWMMGNSIFPLLAEASPTAFLDVVENAVDLGGALLGESNLLEKNKAHRTALPHGIAWALQSLAWSREFLSRSCLLLGRLLELELLKNEDGTSFRALSQILFPLLPQTEGSSQDRLETIELLLQEAPTIGWRLLIDLFPQKGGIVTTNYRPVWREIVSDDWKFEVVSRREFNYQIESLSDLVIDLVCDDFEKLSDNDFVQLLPDLSHAAFQKALTILLSPQVSEKTDHHRLTLWKRLASLHRHHAEFVDAAWSFDEDDVVELGKVVKALSPHDPKTIFRLVFSNDVRLLISKFELDFEDWKAYEQERESLRRQTVKNALETDGLYETIELAKKVREPIAFGLILAEFASAESDRLILNEWLIPNPPKTWTEVTRTYVQRRQQLCGWKWLETIDHSKWTLAQVGTVLGWMPFAPETWNRVENWLGENEREYWKRTPAYPSNEQEFNYDPALKKLIHYQQRDEAINLLSGLCILEKPFNDNIAFQVLLLDSPTARIGEQETVFKVSKIIEKLQSRQNLSTRKLLAIEWKYLGLLGIHSDFTPVTIEHQLSSDPTYFCEVVSIYHQLRLIPRHEQTKFKPIEIDVSNNIHKMVDRYWNRLPGMSPDGELQPELFEKWIGEVYRLCDNTKLLETAHNFIGKALLGSPPDPNGLWIHHAVANALNDKRAQTMRHAYFMAARNSRGVFRIEGSGVQERELAKKFKAKSKQLKEAGFHRLASTLDSVARSYESDSNYAIKRDQWDYW